MRWCLGAVDGRLALGSWLSRERTGSLSHSHIGMDGMLRWLFKQVNWAGLPRDRDRWIDGWNERAETERRKKERKAERWGSERWKQREGWRERSMAADQRGRGECVV